MSGIVGQLSEEQVRRMLGPARYGEYTMARMQADMVAGGSTQTEESSNGLAVGTILVLALVLAFFLTSWMCVGHPGTFIGWLWHDLLDNIAN